MVSSFRRRHLSDAARRRALRGPLAGTATPFPSQSFFSRMRAFLPRPRAGRRASPSDAPLDMIFSIRSASVGAFHATPYDSLDRMWWIGVPVETDDVPSKYWTRSFSPSLMRGIARTVSPGEAGRCSKLTFPNHEETVAKPSCFVVTEPIVYSPRRVSTLLTGPDAAPSSSPGPLPAPSSTARGPRQEHLRTA